jgi:hypothetical protein
MFKLSKDILYNRNTIIEENNFLKYRRGQNWIKRLEVYINHMVNI